MIQDINIGTAANNKTGTPARQAGQIINDNFKSLKDQIITIQNPDTVLKKGSIGTNGLNVHVDADAFNWRIDQDDFLLTPEYNAVLDAATDGHYRNDVLLGNNLGGYNIFKGVEDPISATEPTAFPVGTIKLGVIHVFGAAITNAVVDDNGPIPYLVLRRVAKGPGNMILDKDEPGDTFEGYKNSGTYWVRAIWNGGDRNDRLNYSPKSEYDI